MGLGNPAGSPPSGRGRSALGASAEASASRRTRLGVVKVCTLKPKMLSSETPMPLQYRAFRY